MEKHLIQPDLAGFPPEILPYFKNTEIYDSSSSERARVYYCDRGYFVKVAPKGYHCYGCIQYGQGCVAPCYRDLLKYMDEEDESHGS